MSKSKKEVVRWLPETQKINDKNLREETIRVFAEEAPDYFWKIPASSSGKYHPEDTVGDHGLIIHTKRAFKVQERMLETYLKMGRVNEDEADYARSAILLHDLFKQGLLPRSSKNTQSNHDSVAANYLEENSSLPEEVIECVRTHNGGWSTDREPETELESLHHVADMISSGSDIYVEPLKPLPEKLEGISKV